MSEQEIRLFGERLTLTRSEISSLLDALHIKHQELRGQLSVAQVDIAFGQTTQDLEQAKIRFFRALAELDQVESIAQKVRRSVALSPPSEE